MEIICNYWISRIQGELWQLYFMMRLNEKMPYFNQFENETRWWRYSLAHCKSVSFNFGQQYDMIQKFYLVRNHINEKLVLYVYTKMKWWLLFKVSVDLDNNVRLQFCLTMFYKSYLKKVTPEAFKSYQSEFRRRVLRWTINKRPIS